MSLREVRLRQALFGMILGGVLVTGCSSTGTVTKPDQADVEKTAVAASEAKASSVEFINIVGEGDKVLIGTTAPVKYTVFKLTDPSRLIVDMPGVDVNKVASPLKIGNEFLSEITAVNYGDNKDIGRVVITLKDGIDHDIKSSDKSILVSLSKAAEQAAAPAGAAVNASAMNTTEAASAEDGKAAPESPAPQAREEKSEKAQAAAPASKVLRIESSTEGENTVVRVLTDGKAGNFTSFDLAKPARVVVDIVGVANSTGKDSQKLKDKYLKDVRIGSYADKSRLVFDAAGKKLPPHSIVAEDGAIVITFGPKVVPAANSAALSAAPAAAEATAPLKEARLEPVSAEKTDARAEAKPAIAMVQAEGTKIQSIDYKKAGDKGRLTIAASSRLEYSIKEGKDGRTVAIDLKGASIPEELVRTLDAAKLNTAVASISSYQDSLSPRSVRVLVKFATLAAYTVQESDAALVFDFAQVQAKEGQQVSEGSEKLVIKATELADSREYNGKRIDLDMMDANVSDILRLLAEVSNLNIVASDDVKGTISLRLKNVPWDQAFDTILKAKELDSIREGNVIRVAPKLKIRQEREASLASKKAQEKLEDLEIEFIPVNYAKADELVKQVKSVLSERGEVSTDPRTNTMIVKDIKTGVEKARNVITRLDTQVPQVLIEARIVEASSNFARDLGIQWDLHYGTGGNTTTNLFGASGTAGQFATQGQTPNGLIDTTGPNQFAVNLPASGLAGPLGGFGFQVARLGGNLLALDLRLTAGETEGLLKTISRPRITTMDNKEAKIEQGESIPFETTSASGTATTFVDANLSLTVTPHITPDGSVMMKIKASRNSIGSFKTSSGQPSINKKESTTDVLVKDGETTVIGGIVITDKSDIEKGIPFLKDIPVLGWFFRSKSVTDNQTELLIFITPKIMKDKKVG